MQVLVGISISNSQKLIAWMYREIEVYGRHYEPFQPNEDLYNF